MKTSEMVSLESAGKILKPGGDRLIAVFETKLHETFYKFKISFDDQLNSWLRIVSCRASNFSLTDTRNDVSTSILPRNLD